MAPPGQLGRERTLRSGEYSLISQKTDSLLGTCVLDRRSQHQWQTAQDSLLRPHRRLGIEDAGNAILTERVLGR
jgi:hypothetical protein